MTISSGIKRNPRRNFGQALPEYALILALVAVFCIGALISFRDTISTSFKDMATRIGQTTASP